MQNAFNPKWIELARMKDQDALAELYRYAQQDVYIVLLTTLRTDAGMIEDLMQETFIKAFDKLDQLERPENFRAWVRQIARNTALDHIRKSRVLAFSELYIDENMAIEIEDPDTSHMPHIALDRQETLRLIHEILDNLPDGQRAVISMHYLQGIPVKEIAAILGRSENTIKVQLFQGRKSLEARIRELEKKEDIKLYSIAPMAFLLLLVRGLEAMPPEPDIALLEQILRQQTASVGSTTTAVVKTAASHLAGKIAAVGVAIALGGGALGICMAQPKTPAETPTEPIIETTVHTEPVTEPTEPVVQYDYEQLVEDYMAIISGKIPIDDAGMDLSNSALWITPGGSVIDEDGYFAPMGTVRYSFVRIDLDEDGTDELISLEEYRIGDSDWRGTILDIFTMKNGEPTWLVAGAYRGYVDIFRDGIIRVASSGGATYSDEEYFELCDGELVPVLTGTIEDGEFFINGESCSKESYYETVDQFVPMLALDLERLVMIQP